MLINVKEAVRYTGNKTRAYKFNSRNPDVKDFIRMFSR